MIWKKEVTNQEIQKFCEGTLSSHLGIEFVEVGEDFLLAKMPVDDRTRQPYGLLHGGASVAFAETLGSVAASLCMEETKAPVGVEINANHLKAMREGYVFGKVFPVRIGQTLHVWQIEIFDEKKNLVCTSRITIMAVNKKK